MMTDINFKFSNFKKQTLPHKQYYMKALVIGATGATGKDLVKQLLNDHDFEQIDIFVRKPVDIQDPKLNVHVVNFDQPEFEFPSDTKFRPRQFFVRRKQAERKDRSPS